MSDEEVLDKLYRYHTSWIIMAERLMPAFYPMTAEDIVQEIYLKIYQKNLIFFSSHLLQQKASQLHLFF